MLPSRAEKAPNTAETPKSRFKGAASPHQEWLRQGGKGVPRAAAVIGKSTGSPGSILEAARSFSADQRKGWFGDTTSSMFRAFGLNTESSAVTDPFAQHPWVRSAIDVQATALAGSPFMIYSGTREDRQVVEDHNRPGGSRSKEKGGQEWVDLFSRVNPLYTPYELWYAYVAQMLVTGESVWLLWDARSGSLPKPGQKPTEIYPLPGNCAMHHVSPTTNLIEGWTISLGTKSYEVPADGVLQFKVPDWRQPWRGLSPMAALALATSQDRAQDLFNEAYYDNSCDAGGFLVHENAKSIDELKKVRQDFESRHKGARNRGRMGFLAGAWRFFERKVDNQSAQMVEGQKWRRDQVLAVLNVTEYDIGLIDNANRATAVEAERRLYTKNVIPKSEGVSTRLWKWMREFDDARYWGEHSFEHVEALGEAPDERRKTALEYYKAGFATRNELNKRYDLGFDKDTEFGDERLVPSGYEPIAMVVDPTAGLDLDPDPEEDPDAPTPPPADEEDTESVDTDDDADEEAGAGKASTLRTQGGQPAPGVSRKRRDPKDIWATQEKQLFTPFERQFRSLVLSHFNGLRRETLSNLNEIVNPPEVPDIAASFGDAIDRAELTASDVVAILFNGKRADDRLKRAAMKVYRAIVKRQRALLRDELGGLNAFQEGSPEVEAMLDNKLSKVTRVNETVRREITNAILAGLSENESVTQIRSRVRETFKSSASRSLNIARTETAQSSNGARFVAFRMEGVSEHEWSSSDDEHVREAHANEDGSIVRLGEIFPETGLLHPGDLNGPAEQVVNCRCIAVAAD